MPDLLFAWLGNSDLQAASSETPDGPIASAVLARRPDEVVVVSSQSAERTRDFGAWLHRATGTRVVVHAVTLSSPTHLGDIHQCATAAVADALARHRGAKLTFHLSPGTPAMAAVWIILGKTRYPAAFIESSRGHGVRDVDVPFSLSAEFLPDLLRAPDAELERLAAELPPPAPEFAALLHRSTQMRRLIARARRVAVRSVSVLIEGESGTGKELLARAIHHGSARARGPFIAVNCGAIPESLIESELFGHEKGAFTGASAARLGHFREAEGGTLFLDEFTELPLSAQVKLLRALQENEVTAVGSSRAVPVDVRIVAASNRNVLEAVGAGIFRSDLFYRLAVAILVLPPLRERLGDLDLLIDYVLNQINAESRNDPGYQAKKLEPAARAVLHAHPWPGNVRELWNTLRRAALWTPGATIRATDIREALLPAPAAAGSLLRRPLGSGFDLSAVLGEVARHYLARALEESQGNKSRAAELLGFASHQTLSNWLRRYGLT
jgi:DNA-binding NtrC family response regulator